MAEQSTDAVRRRRRSASRPIHGHAEGVGPKFANVGSMKDFESKILRARRASVEIARNVQQSINQARESGQPTSHAAPEPAPPTPLGAPPVE
jgi:hypothetical protein